MQVCDELLRCKADVNAQNNPNSDKESETPLKLAARYGFYNTVDLLLCNGADVQSELHPPNKVLGSKWKAVQGPDPPGPAGKELLSEPLAMALRGKQEFSPEERDSFALKGLKVDSFIKVGDGYFQQADKVGERTSLIRACEYDHQTTAAKLLTACPRLLFTKDAKGRTPLIAAASAGSTRSQAVIGPTRPGPDASLVLSPSLGPV